MFNVIKKRQSYLDDKAKAKPPQMAPSHDQRRGAEDKLEEARYPKFRRMDVSEGIVPNDAQKAQGIASGKMSHADYAVHHQKLADHFRQVADGTHEPGGDSAGPTHTEETEHSGLEEDY